MSEYKEHKVFLYFLMFNAEDLKVFFDEAGVAAVSYNGNYPFLENTNVIQHCFNEGYITRRDDTALILYAYTDEPSIAKLFECTRNMNIFMKQVMKMDEVEYTKLIRYKEAQIVADSFLCGVNEYMGMVMTAFERMTILDITPEVLIADWSDVNNVFEFMPMENGEAFMDECLSDSLMDALSYLKFRALMGEDEPSPSDAVDINEWNIFYHLFSNTLR